MPRRHCIRNLRHRLKPEPLRHARSNLPEHLRCGIELASRPQIARALDFPDGQVTPRVGLVMGALLPIHRDAQAPLPSLLPAHITELVEQLRGRQDQRRAHRLRPAGVIHEHIRRPHLPLPEQRRNGSAQRPVTRPEFLESIDLDEIPIRMPVELHMNLVRHIAAPRRAKIPDVRRPMLAEGEQHRRRRPANGDEGRGY